MRLKTDLEFQQNEIKRYNKKCNIECLVRSCLGEKLMLQNRKLESLKKLLFKSKKAHKATSTSTRFELKMLIGKATANMNNI